MKPRIFFDLDGVLADMEGGLKKNPEIIELRTILDNLIETKFEDYKGLVDDDIKTKFKSELESNPESPVKELKKAFNKYTSKVFSIAAKPGFYRNLDLMPGAKEMVLKAQELTGELPNILTAPVGDENDLDNPSVKEKREWVEEHFGGMVNEVIVTIDKGSVVKGKSDILIDDRPKYVEKFTSKGGTAILHKDWKKTIIELESIVSSFLKTESMKYIKKFIEFDINIFENKDPKFAFDEEIKSDLKRYLAGTIYDKVNKLEDRAQQLMNIHKRFIDNVRDKMSADEIAKRLSKSL